MPPLYPPRSPLNHSAPASFGSNRVTQQIFQIDWDYTECAEALNLNGSQWRFRNIQIRNGEHTLNGCVNTADYI